MEFTTLWTSSHFSHTPAPENLYSTLCFMSLACLDSTYKRYQTVFVFFCLTFLTQPSSLNVHPYCCKRQDLLFHSWMIFHCIYTTFYLSIHLFKIKKKFYWSIVDLQCFVSFRCTAKWFSYTYTCIYCFSSSFPI